MVTACYLFSLTVVCFNRLHSYRFANHQRPDVWSIQWVSFTTIFNQIEIVRLVIEKKNWKLSTVSKIATSALSKTKRIYIFTSTHNIEARLCLGTIIYYIKKILIIWWLLPSRKENYLHISIRRQSGKSLYYENVQLKWISYIFHWFRPKNWFRVPDVVLEGHQIGCQITLPNANCTSCFPLALIL